MSVAQSCLFATPVDYSLPGSSVHGILQASILECVAILFSRRSSQPRSPTLQADSLPSELPGKSVRPIISDSRYNWLGFCASTAGAQVSSLAGELRSDTLQGAVKEKKKDRCSKAHVLGIISHNSPCSFLLTAWCCQGLYGCLLRWTPVFLERDISLIQLWFFH